MKKHKHQKLINIWLYNPEGAILEGMYDGLWNPVNITTLINEPYTTKYRLSPNCQRAYDFVTEQCGDDVFHIYDSWISGAELEVKPLNTDWTDDCEIISHNDDPVLSFVALYKHFDGRVRIKEENEVMWICDNLFWEPDGNHTFLPYIYIPESKEKVELVDIDHYVDCNKMIKEIWHKVPTKVRKKGV